MFANKLFDEVFTTLEASKKNIRCSELAEQLELLGFEVRDGKKGGHKIFVHDGISSFRSGSYNCGHGRNPEIKPAYIGKALTVLRQYETEIVGFLKGENYD